MAKVSINFETVDEAGFKVFADADFDLSDFGAMSPEQAKLALVANACLCEMTNVLGGGLAALAEAAKIQDGEAQEDAEVRVAAVEQVLRERGILQEKKRA